MSPALTPANDALRAVNVTASEVGALLDKHPYTSPARIWDRLTGSSAYVPPEQTESMLLGVWFEDRIARYTARKLGVQLRANSRTRVHRYVNLAATPDYIVLNHPMLVECKLSSIMYGWSEEKLAPHIEWQARAQLACTDREVCFVAALVGSQYYTIPVVRTVDDERRMLEAVAAFWLDHVNPGIRPDELPAPRISRVVVEASGSKSAS